VPAAVVRPFQTVDHPACEAILRALPAWFGIEEATAAYLRAIPRLDSFVATIEDTIVGFISLEEHNPQSAEIHVMGVIPERHGAGIGRALVEHAERFARERRIEYLQVKTLGPSRANAEYERTRGFYRRLGFVPLEENRLWGESNPCLILVKHLRCP
jgi:GNAT superfamily N-acetyltransferase